MSAWGSVWVEEAAERCLTGKGAGSKNLQRPEDVEAVKCRGGRKNMCTRRYSFLCKSIKARGSKEGLKNQRAEGLGAGLERQVWAEGWGLLAEVDCAGWCRKRPRR